MSSDTGKRGADVPPGSIMQSGGGPTIPAAIVAKVRSSMSTKLPVMRSASYGSTAKGIPVWSATTPMSFSRSSLRLGDAQLVDVEPPPHLLDDDRGHPGGVLESQAVSGVSGCSRNQHTVASNVSVTRASAFGGGDEISAGHVEVVGQPERDGQPDLGALERAVRRLDRPHRGGGALGNTRRRRPRRKGPPFTMPA